MKHIGKLVILLGLALGLCSSAVAQQGSRYFPTLYDAIAAADVEATRSHLAQDPGQLNVKGYLGATPLIYALSRTPISEPIVRLLITLGANVNEKDRGMTPLMHAVSDSHRSYRVANLLINSGASVNAADGNGTTVLMYAVGRLPVSFMCFPVDEPSGKTTEPSLPIIQLLLSKGANLEARTNDGATVIMFAGHELDVIKFLMSKGADITATAKDNTNILYGIIAHDHRKPQSPLDARPGPAVCPCLDAIRLAVSKGVDFNLKSTLGWTPLHVAVRYGNVVAAEYLISKGVDVNSRTSGGLASMAFDRCDNAMIALLARSGADISAKYEKDQTFLHKVASKEAVQALLDRGADVNAQDKLGRTPLHWITGNFALSRGMFDSPTFDASSVQKELRECIDLLVSKGADVNRRDKSGRTPLHYSVGCLAAVWIYRDPLKPISEGMSVPLYAMHQYQWFTEPVVEALLANKADVNIKDNDGRTPLHCAEETGIIKRLIEKGADVNARDNEGCTPLHRICAQNVSVSYVQKESFAESWTKANPLRAVSLRKDDENAMLQKAVGEALDLFVLKGADINAKDNKGLTPLAYAVQNGRDTLVKALKEHCAVE